MKKRNLKSLKLNKQAISNFKTANSKGGVTFTQFLSCFGSCEILCDAQESVQICQESQYEPGCVDPISLNNDCISLFDDCYTIWPNQAC